MQPSRLPRLSCFFVSHRDEADVRPSHLIYEKTNMGIITFLVDDDAGFSASLIPVLKEFTDVHIVELAQTPVEAVSLMAKYEQKWQLLILDIGLRNGTGLSVLQACQNRLPHQEVIVLSNMATAQVRSRCLRLGASAVFDKATELDKFVAHCKGLEALAL
jgi:two-component system, OmpR family, response regulator